MEKLQGKLDASYDGLAKIGAKLKKSSSLKNASGKDLLGQMLCIHALPQASRDSCEPHRGGGVPASWQSLSHSCKNSTASLG